MRQSKAQLEAQRVRYSLIGFGMLLAFALVLTCIFAGLEVYSCK